MSGPYHERAVCPCGWTTPCRSDLHFLTDNYGRFTNVCPACGASKYGMEIGVYRWHNGTWRNREDRPYNGVEPPEPSPTRWRWWFAPLIVLALAGGGTALIMWLAP